MGNQPASTKRLAKQSKYSRNSYSLDEISLMSQMNNKITAEKDNRKSLNESLQLPSQRLQASVINDIPKESFQVEPKRAASVAENNSVSKKQQNDARLVKLNKKNDELRKQLIKISSQLTSKLHKKRFNAKKKEQEEDNDHKVPALKRQLQNGYKQIDRYKKILRQKKEMENPKHEETVMIFENKINQIDAQIKQTMNQMQAIKNIQSYRQKAIKKAQTQASLQSKQSKEQVEKLKQRIKSFSKKQRVNQNKQKYLQEYMFQLQRKKRQLFGQYLPQIKSYANKNFQPQPKYEKKKKDDTPNFKPAKWQFDDAEDQIASLKQKHEQYHLKLEKALKSKNQIKQQTQRLKKVLEEKQKQFQNLKYKRQRYVQLIMGNIQYLMNEEQQVNSSQGPLQNGGFRVVTRGNDIPEQVLFDDHELIKNIDLSKVKIVSVNIWYTNKHQIAAIQAIYSNGKDCFQGRKSSNTSAQMEKQILQVDQGDYIKNIMGIFNKKGAIQFLAFNSMKGKARQFGKQLVNGLNFTLGLTKRQKPVCLSGYSFFDGSYWRLNKLVVDVSQQS